MRLSPHTAPQTILGELLQFAKSRLINFDLAIVLAHVCDLRQHIPDITS